MLAGPLSKHGQELGDVGLAHLVEALRHPALAADDAADPLELARHAHVLVDEVVEGAVQLADDATAPGREPEPPAPKPQGCSCSSTGGLFPAACLLAFATLRRFRRRHPENHPP